ncbi:ABC transporter substrate-binding protein [Lichenifustis flavocetrariae]|uniref:ABC transporter substrate-binding protein n=1 Tax=Lichenifustis flavocetrariae TaxID=2949735 RepID=A0AA41Z0M8_9HYPH|nr:ABC transporter substrate-binding protein [Lichenifustis flavocetrariae]MCW6510781.1 ABC transporter substrate-binding protein [Lichenifustis flavocetrariae]
MTHSNIDRRTALRLGLGASAAGLFVATGGLALADAISSAKIDGSPEMAKGVQKSGKLRIGFSNGFSGNTWRTECLTSMQSEAKANADKYDLIVVDGQGDISKQVNDIEDLISQNVDALLCIPNSSTAVVPALRKATRAGIPTIPFNLPVEGENWTAFIGTDPKRKGATTGKALNGFLGGKGKIVALGGLPGNSYTADCWAGAQTQFGPGIEVLAFKDASWQEDKAKVVMADLIAAYPEIDGIWCDGGQDAAGALKALIAANRPLVPATGDDYNGLFKLYDAEKEKNPKFKIGCVSEPSWEGVVALRTAVKLLSGQDVPKRQIIDPILIDGSNYQQFMKKDLPDGVFVDTLLTDEELKKLFS